MTTKKKATKASPTTKKPRRYDVTVTGLPQELHEAICRNANIIHSNNAEVRKFLMENYPLNETGVTYLELIKAGNGTTPK